MSKTFDDPDLPATAEELAQAEALARSLDGAGGGGSPELETAALLRQAHGAEVPEVVDEILPALKARPRRRWWLWPVMLVPAAAGLLVLATGTLSYRAARPTALQQDAIRPPATQPPSAELLAVQSRAATGDRAALAALEAEMRRFRPRLFREAVPR
jgi:hypothetical protein